MRELAAALKLSREKGVGAARFRRLIDEYLLPSVALSFWKSRLNAGHVLGAVSLGKSRTTAQIRKTLALIKTGKLLGWYYSQPGYPTQLKDLGEPPPLFFATSAVPSVRFAAVVGARNMAAGTPALVNCVCRKLVENGYAIVSGGAAGVDAVAHETALVGGVYTLAILGTGLDVVYPVCNRELFERIRVAGALMTELMPGTRPARSFFPTRNRIIAAMAEVVVVVQASENSGSMITADWARRLNRRLLVVAPPPADDTPMWAGNQRLLAAGAEEFTF